MQTYLSISPRYFASPPNLLIFPTVNFLPREDLFCVNCRVARPGNLLKNAGKCCLFFLPFSVSSLCHFEISFAKKKLFFLLFFFLRLFLPLFARVTKAGQCSWKSWHFHISQLWQFHYFFSRCARENQKSSTRSFLKIALHLLLLHFC